MEHGSRYRGLGVAALAAVAFAAAGCGHALADMTTGNLGGDGTLRVALAVPESLPAVSARSFPYSPAARIFVAPVDDARQDASRIGANVEGASPVAVVATGMTPPDFVRTALARELAGAGLAVSTREDAANFVLHVRLVHFFVEEGNTYHGDVRATVEVRDGSGAVKFGVAIAGTAVQWGRSLSDENYREVLTRASLDLTKNLLENAQFQAALSGPASVP